MPRWKTTGWISAHELDETSLILVTLAVKSGVMLDEALHCLHKMSNVEALLPVCGRDLSPSFALAGCVAREELTEMEAMMVEVAAKEQYPDWDEVKERIRLKVREGHDPRWH